MFADVGADDGLGAAGAQGEAKGGHLGAVVSSGLQDPAEVIGGPGLSLVPFDLAGGRERPAGQGSR